MCIRDRTEAIQTKFCTVMKTTKNTLWVVAEFPLNYGGWHHLEKMINWYISASVWLILMKFCMLMHIGSHDHNGCSKIQIFKNPRWWQMAAILKSIKCDIFATVPPIVMKFGMTMHISPSHFDQWKSVVKIWKVKNPRWQMVAILKIEKLWYLQQFGRFCWNFVWVAQNLTCWSKIQISKKCKMVDSCHFVKCSISASVWLILTKFGIMMNVSSSKPTGNGKIGKVENTRWQMMPISVLSRCSKIQILKIQVWGSLPF